MESTALDPARSSRIAWLAAHAAHLRSIDIADDDFADMEAVANAVGGARIVMLGEQTHDDGTTFLAKGRFVRFLHERMGFDVLAFESGLYEMRKIWERIRNGEVASMAARRGLFPIWSHSEQVRPLIDYIGERAHSTRPLELAGFDCQCTGTATRDRLVDDLSAFLTAHGVAASIAHWPVFCAVVDKLSDTANSAKWKPSEEERHLIFSTIDALIGSITNKDDAETAFWCQVLKSLKAFTQLLAFDLTDWPMMVKGFNVRDAAMADNLIWLARDVYPRRKIMVWAATFHNFRYPEITTPDGRVNMGTHLWQALGNDIYNIAFTGYAGKRGKFGREPAVLAPPPVDSLEGLWGATSQQNAFLDLRRIPAGGEWLQQPFRSRVLSESSEAAAADWSRFIDAVVFVRDMQPSAWAE